MNKLAIWSIPVTGYDGITTQVVVGEDGAVWVAQNYTLIRLDPALRSVSSISLDPHAAGAVSSALTGATEGTGISAIAADGTGILVGRFDVTSLTRVDANLSVTGYVKLPRGASGPTSLARAEDGSIIMLSGAFSTGVLTVLNPDGSLRSTNALNAAAVRVSGPELVISGGSASGSRIAVGHSLSQDAGALHLGPYSQAVPDPRGGQALFDDLDGSLLRVLNGTIVGSISLPKHGVLGQPDVPAPQPGGTYYPMSTLGTLPAQVFAMVDDPTGETWCFDMASRTLYGVRID
jgi:hypothetical protein